MQWHHCREFMDRLAMCMDLLADQKAAQALRLRYGVLDGKQRTLEQVGKAMKPQVSIAQAHNLVRPRREMARLLHALMHALILPSNMMIMMMVPVLQTASRQCCAFCHRLSTPYEMLTSHSGQS